MRRAIAIFLIAGFAIAIEISIGLNGGYFGLFSPSAQLSYHGSNPEREFNQPRSFTRLAGGDAEVFAGIGIGRFSMAVSAVWGRFEPYFDSRFEVANTALGVAIEVPSVGLEGWRLGVRGSFAFVQKERWAMELVGRYYFLHKLRTTSYAEEPFQAYITESPWGGYVFRLVADEYAQKDAEASRSWEGSLLFRYRLWGGALSGWITLEFGYSGLEWELLYYSASNSGGFGRLGLLLR